MNSSSRCTAHQFTVYVYISIDLSNYSQLLFICELYSLKTQVSKRLWQNRRMTGQTGLAGSKVWFFLILPGASKLTSQPEPYFGPHLSQRRLSTHSLLSTKPVRNHGLCRPIHSCYTFGNSVFQVLQRSPLLSQFRWSPMNYSWFLC